MADALYGTATFVDGASTLFNGVQVLSQIRSNQNIRAGKRDQHVADYFATHPGRPTASASEAVRRWGRWSGVRGCMYCAHKTKRFIVAIKYAEEETYRYLIFLPTSVGGRLILSRAIRSRGSSRFLFRTGSPMKDGVS